MLAQFPVRASLRPMVEVGTDAAKQVAFVDDFGNYYTQAQVDEALGYKVTKEQGKTIRDIIKAATTIQAITAVPARVSQLGDCPRIS